MDGQTYAVADDEHLKTYIKPIFEPKGGRPLRGRPPFGASIREM